MTIIDRDLPRDHSTGDEDVALKYVYSESYVRAGKRKPVRVNFWADGFIIVRTLATGEAPPACHIVGESGCLDPDYTIREHNGSLYWPLLEAGRILSKARFHELAAVGHSKVQNLLGIGGGWPQREDRTTFYRDNPIKEILGDTRAEMQTQAQAAAENIIICEDTRSISRNLMSRTILSAITSNYGSSR